MIELLLLVTVLIWVPLIPLRLVIQSGITLWRRLGDISYLLFTVYWAIVDLWLLSNRPSILVSLMPTPSVTRGVGAVLILASLVFGYWTASTLGFITFTTRPQVAPAKSGASLIISGPYRYLRHPFYFSEWFLLSGVALATGSRWVLILLIVALIVDPFVTFFEEKELGARFGKDYADYKKRVPRLLPTLAPLFSKGNH